MVYTNPRHPPTTHTCTDALWVPQAFKFSPNSGGDFISDRKGLVNFTDMHLHYGPPGHYFIDYEAEDGTVVNDENVLAQSVFHESSIGSLEIGHTLGPAASFKVVVGTPITVAVWADTDASATDTTESGVVFDPTFAKLLQGGCAPRMRVPRPPAMPQEPAATSIQLRLWPM